MNVSQYKGLISGTPVNSGIHHYEYHHIGLIGFKYYD